LLWQRFPEFNYGTCDLIDVEQQWAEVPRAGDGDCSRVGHRCGGDLGVGWSPVLVAKVAGRQQGGTGDSGQLLVRERQLCMNRIVRRIDSRSAALKALFISATRSGCAAIASEPSSASNSILVSKGFGPSRR